MHLANVSASTVCGTELYPALNDRLRAMLPAGTAVTVVWTEPTDRSASGQAYVHLAPPRDSATKPQDPSINERLVSEGSVALDPPIRREAGSSPAANQIAVIRAEAQPVAVPYIDALAAADIAAWDNRVGAIGRCRIDSIRKPSGIANCTVQMAVLVRRTILSDRILDTPRQVVAAVAATARVGSAANAGGAEREPALASIFTVSAGRSLWLAHVSPSRHDHPRHPTTPPSNPYTRQPNPENVERPQ